VLQKHSLLAQSYDCGSDFCSPLAAPLLNKTGEAMLEIDEEMG